MKASVVVMVLLAFLASFGATAEEVEGEAEEVYYSPSVARPNMEQLEILDRREEEKEKTRSEWWLRDHICHQDEFVFSKSEKLKTNPTERCYPGKHGEYICLSKVQAANGREIGRKRKYRCCTGYYLPKGGFDCVRGKTRK
ncbi:hypothetical protein JTE90_019062 [Oedothorax gibbosus]|uniref:Uncharacterized protein n=1 Tax=Oedothorax gibbosus TaxID=931172 RepID=A0AAV6UYM4_9ARAC|nr:hypothetical protein JTE90_019062 [Oedothorax gibbosus]